LKKGAVMHIVTDHEDLWKWCEEHFKQNASLFTRKIFCPAESARDGELVGTNFERKYMREGRPFFATTLVRID
jgi:tRNA G46 methylase TrmB